MHRLQVEERVRHGRRHVEAQCTCGWRGFDTDASLVRFVDAAAIHEHFDRPPVEGGRRTRREP